MTNAFDWRRANLARQTGPVIDHRFELKMASRSISVGEIPQGAPAFGDGLRQYLPNGPVKQGGARFADAQCGSRGANASHKQYFGSINVAYAHNSLAAKQDLLDRCLPAF